MTTTRFQLVFGIVVVAFNVGCNYNADEYIQTPERLSEYLSLKIVSGEPKIPADGFSLVKLEAKTDPSAASQKRTVIFTTSHGMLLGGSKEGDGQAVDINTQGVATIYLQSAQQIGDAMVQARIKNVSGPEATLVIHFIKVDPDTLLQFTVVPPDGIEADGASIKKIVVEVDPDIPGDARTVKFTTSAGSFVGGSGESVDVPADLTAGAVAYLRIPNNPGTVQLTASINGVVRNTSFHLVPAVAEDIILDPGTFSLKAGSSETTTLRAQLLRTTGMVSLGTKVDFTASDANGLFRAQTTSNDKGEATVIFSPGTGSTAGTVRLKACVTVAGNPKCIETPIELTP